MANVAFSGLSALTSLARGDLIAATDVSEAGAEQSKKVTITTLEDYLMIRGGFVRPTFSYKDADEIYVDAGWYNVSDKWAGWASQLTVQLAGAAANTRYYVYLDYSGITSGTAVTASEVIYSTSAPSWSHALRGWYNGSDRCIFSVLTDSNGNIKEFFHDGDFVMYADEITDRADADLDTTWTDVTLSIPGFSKRAAVMMYSTSSVNATSCILYWRTNGQSGSTGHRVIDTYYTNVSAARYHNSANVITDSSQKIEVKHSVAGTQTCAVYTNGWFLPVGM
jgi:hypothetical protein